MTMDEQWEQWRVVPDHDDYEVSNLGNARWADDKAPISLSPDVRGNPCIKEWDGEQHHFYAIHHFVMCAFVGIADLDCRRKDGNKANNRLDNLEYVTRAETIQAAYDDARNNPAYHAAHPITPKMHERILSCYWDRAMSFTEIVRYTGYSMTAVRQVVEDDNQAYPNASVPPCARRAATRCER